MHDQFVCEASVEEVLHDLLLFRAFDEVLNSVDQHVEELVYVLLNVGVNRTSIDVLECEAELLWIEILLLKFHQCPEDPLDLVDDVFADRHSSLLVFNFEHGFLECRDHEQILHNTVHIADASDVLEADETSAALLLLVDCGDGPVRTSGGSPEPADIA